MHRRQCGLRRRHLGDVHSQQVIRVVQTQRRKELGELHVIRSDRRTDLAFTYEIRPFEKGSPEESRLFHAESFERSVVWELPAAALLAVAYECSERRPRHIVRS